MRYYVVDAFTTEVFKGNPAGVCVVEGDWPTPEQMQNIAAENRLSETAFVRRRAAGAYDIRYFTPGSEVGLCGHATLGTSFVLAHFVDPDQEVFHFHTRDEEVSALRLPGDRYELDFPAWEPKDYPVTDLVRAALNGHDPDYAGQTRDLVCIVDSPETVRTFQPDQAAIAALPRDLMGLLLTAPGTDCDVVCRTFFPNIAIPEDPVCGSAQCTLIPLWAKRLGKTELVIRQLSPRTGVLYGKLDGDRVRISGNAAMYLSGEIHV